MPGARTGVAVREGVFAAVDGRWGEVTQYLEGTHSCGQVILRWLDSYEEHGIRVDKLSSVVASRVELVEECENLGALRAKIGPACAVLA